MASQKSSHSPVGPRSNSSELKKRKSKSSKQGIQLDNKAKPKMKFKKVKKISKSIKRIESEISSIQTQMGKIGKDLTIVLDLIQTKK